jgi:pimeloyl-ACP methyl ester carboxylesterase
MELTHREARLRGVPIHYVEAGAGPPVVLLHGFPEFWYCWRRQMEVLARAGFRAVAPDQRGYNRSGKPRDVAAYRVDELAADVAALIRHLGAERAAVAGHDWGGAVAWHLARHRPDILDRLVVLNAPHPEIYRRRVRSPAQLLRSWYVFFFQLPLLPELAFRAFDYALLERVLRREPVRPGAFDEEDVRRYREALDRPGALTAAVNWYRAAFRDGMLAGGGDRRARRDADGEGSVRNAGGDPGSGAEPGPRDPVQVPSLVIWGMRDRYLGPELLEGLDRWVEHLRVERIPDASHWVLADAPERVGELMRDFLRAE